MRPTVRALCLFLLFTGARAQATPPTKFSIQGVLRNNGGQLQSMSINVGVGLFAAQSGGAALATYANNIVSAQNGLFTVTVSDPAVTSIVRGATQLWAELTIAGFGTFPRQEVTSQVYALEASYAQEAATVPVGAIGMRELELPMEQLRLSHMGVFPPPGTYQYWGPPFTPSLTGKCFVSVIFSSIPSGYGCAMIQDSGGVVTVRTDMISLPNGASSGFQGLFVVPVTAATSTRFGCQWTTNNTGVGMGCHMAYFCQ